MQLGFLYLLAASLSVLWILLRTITFVRDSKDLRKYPSILPLAGVTNLVYIAFNQRARTQGITRSEALLATHNEHPIVRLGPNRLSDASPEAIKDIYGTGSKCIKGDQYTTIGGTPNLLSAVDKQVHSIKRKRLSRAFATVHLLEWEHKVAVNVARLCERIDAHAEGGKTLDFRHWSNLFTLDAIMSIALSLDTGFMQSGSATVQITALGGKTRSIDAIECLRSVNRAIEPFVWSKTAYRALKALSFLWPARRRLWDKSADWQAWVRSLVAQRIARGRQGEADDDLFACLLKDSKGQELHLAEAEMAAETAHLVDAGSDTTSIALTHTMYCLAKHPAKLHSLRQELDANLSHLPPSHVPHYSSVRDLPYLRACLDEAMRLRPSLSPGLQRETPAEGTSINGEWVAGHTMVSVSPFVAHRDPRIFPDPEAFVPERWLDGKAKGFAKYILTFSAGGRVCIGKNIAYLELSLVLAAVVRGWDFGLSAGEEWEVEWEEHFNTWPKALPLLFNRRQSVV